MQARWEEEINAFAHRGEDKGKQAKEAKLAEQAEGFDPEVKSFEKFKLRYISKVLDVLSNDHSSAEYIRTQKAMDTIRNCLNKKDIKAAESCLRKWEIEPESLQLLQSHLKVFRYVVKEMPRLKGTDQEQALQDYEFNTAERDLEQIEEELESGQISRAWVILELSRFWIDKNLRR